MNKKQHSGARRGRDGGPNDQGRPRRPDNRKPDGRKPESHKPDGRRPESHKPDARRPESQKPDARRLDSRKPDGRKPDGRKPEARMPETRKPETRKPDMRKPEARKPEFRPERPRPPAPAVAAPIAAPRPQRDGFPRDGARRDEVWIYGIHPVTAAMRNPARKILRIVGTADALARLREDPEIVAASLANVQASGRGELDTLLGAGAVHQGIAVLARSLEPDLAEILAARADTPDICVMVLDQVTDPHNVGAILRSAAAFGAAAVIAPDRGAPEETGTMAKSASGALDIVPYIKGGNLVRVLEELKEQQFWLVGLEADGTKDLSAVDLRGRVALVVGAEGEGLRRLVRETCDHLARLPMQGPMESLNVSNAAAVALYEWTRQVQTKS